MLAQVKFGIFPGIFMREQAETALWVAAVVSAGGSVSAGRRAEVDTLIAGMKSAGVWTKLDRLWLLAAENTQSALVDLVARDLASAVGAPTFTTDVGYTFASGKYIDTNYNPTSDAINYTQNSASAGAWCNSVDTTNYASLFGAYTTGGDQCNILSAVTAWQSYANDSSGAYYGDIATGMVHWSRTASNAHKIFRNGGTGVSSAVTTGGLVNCNVFIGARNNNGGGGDCTSTNQISAAVFGGALSDAEVGSFYTVLRAYMTAVGVP